MTKYTPKLNLLKKDPIQDGNDTFNIKTMLNDNWDKIDDFAQVVEDKLNNVDDLEQTVNDLIEQVGNLEELDTDTKSNIIAAINEIYQEIVTHKADYATQDTLGHIKLSDIPSTADDIGAFDQSNYGNIVSSTVDLTLDLSHANTVLVYGTTSARIITVPNNSSVPFPIGTQITVIRDSTGTVTFIPASGVTLNSKDNKRSIDGRYASATLIKTDTNKWVLIGALV